MVAAFTAAGIKHRFVHYKDGYHMRITNEMVNEMLAFIAEVDGR